MKVGVLAIQGDVIEHIETLKKLNVDVVEVRLPEDFKGIKGLIIPGESTTLIKLMKRFDVDKEIVKRYKNNKLAIFGTCAGAILLAKTILNHPNQPGLGLIDIEIQRNGYGRQIDSFEKKEKIFGKSINCIFIRAPVIKSVGKGVKVIKKIKTPVLIEEKNIIISTFHPELSDSTVIHKHFVDMCKNI